MADRCPKCGGDDLFWDGSTRRCYPCRRAAQRMANQSPEQIERRRASRRAADNSEKGTQRRRRWWHRVGYLRRLNRDIELMLREDRESYSEDG